MVELLVVIGIIAALISILLPTLSHVRAMGDASRCLSNLKQIGVAIAHYSNEHDGCLVPGDYIGMVDDPSRIGAGSWADILVSGQYIFDPQGGYSTDSQYFKSPTSRDNILFCPNGQDLDSAPSSFPSTLTDGSGTFFSARGSDTESIAVKVWYGINCIVRRNGASLSPQDLRPRPFNFVPDYGAGTPDMRLNRITQFNDTTRLPLVFDGVWCFVTSPNLNPICINARHNNLKYTNILFADFHCESQMSTTLPNDDWYLK